MNQWALYLGDFRRGSRGLYTVLERGCLFLNPFCENGFLLPMASLNKVKVVSLGEWELEEEFRNRFGSELISGGLFRKQLLEFIEWNRSDLVGFQVGVDPIEILNGCLQDEMSKHSISAEANRIVKKHAIGLAYLLLTLKTGLEENRKARMDWSQEHWAYWNRMEKVFLCGGLTYDCIGKTLLQNMQEVFDRVGENPYQLEIAAQGTVLPMIGANWMMAKETDAQLVFDFGHSFIKAGLFENGKLVQVRRTQSRFVDLNTDADLVKETAEQLHAFIKDTVLFYYKEFEKTGSDLGRTIGMVFANYVRDLGTMYTGRGGYAKLGLLAERYGDLIAAELSDCLHTNISVEMFHDGTAGAKALKGHTNAAVISLGTGLGVGFTEM